MAHGKNVKSYMTNSAKKAYKGQSSYSKSCPKQSYKAKSNANRMPKKGAHYGR